MVPEIAGFPVEEAAFSLGPLAVLALSLGIALAKERTRRRAYRRHYTSVQSRAGDPAELRPKASLDTRVAAGLGDRRR